MVADVIEDFESLQSISRILGAEIVSSSAADHVVKIEITMTERLTLESFGRTFSWHST